MALDSIVIMLGVTEMGKIESSVFYRQFSKFQYFINTE